MESFITINRQQEMPSKLNSAQCVVTELFIFCARTLTESEHVCSFLLMFVMDSVFGFNEFYICEIFPLVFGFYSKQQHELLLNRQNFDICYFRVNFQLIVVVQQVK